MQNNEICLPSKLLAKGGQPPAEGSPVEIQSIKGMVSRVDGDNTYFRLTEANGQPIESKEDDTTLAPVEPTEDSLREAAAKQDEMG